MLVDFLKVANTRRSVSNVLFIFFRMAVLDFLVGELKINKVS